MSLTNILKQKIIRKIKMSNEFMEFSQKAVTSINTALKHRRSDSSVGRISREVSSSPTQTPT